MRELKFKLKDATLVSDVNQTLSNLLSQIGKTNKKVSDISNVVNNNTEDITELQNPGSTSGITPGAPVALTGYTKWFANADNVPIANTAFQQFPQSSIISYPASWTISFYVTTGPLAVASMTVARTKPGSLEVIDFTQITFNGSKTVIVPSDTLVTSDMVSLQIDADHDYWFLIYGDGSNYHLTTCPCAGGQLIYGGYMGGGIADLTNTTPIQNPPSPSNILSQWIVAWEAQTNQAPQVFTFLQAAWKMLDGSGSTAADSSTNAPNSLTLTGETWNTGSSPLTEKLTFAGGGGGVAAEANTNFANTQPFTVSVWFETSNVSSEVTLCGTLNPSGNYQGWEVNLNGFSDAGDISILLINNFGGSNFIRVTVPFSASTLYHLVFTYDGSDNASNIAVYLNGSPVTATVRTNSLSATIASGVPVYIAEREDASNRYTGDIGPLYIWDRVLTGTEVAALYAAPYSPPA